MITGAFEVWVCAPAPHPCAAVKDPFCFTYSEIDAVFIPWGFKSTLQLEFAPDRYFAGESNLRRKAENKIAKKEKKKKKKRDGSQQGDVQKLKERLTLVKEMYEDGLIDKTIYQEEQREILASITTLTCCRILWSRFGSW